MDNFVCSTKTSFSSIGRAGRLTNGKVFRLYTEEAYEKLPAQLPPEIRRSDLSSTVLYLKALGIDNILRFDFPSKPPAKNLLSALELVLALGIIFYTLTRFSLAWNNLMIFPLLISLAQQMPSTIMET